MHFSCQQVSFSRPTHHEQGFHTAQGGNTPARALMSACAAVVKTTAATATIESSFILTSLAARQQYEVLLWLS